MEFNSKICNCINIQHRMLLLFFGINTVASDIYDSRFLFIYIIRVDLILSNLIASQLFLYCGYTSHWRQPFCRHRWLAHGTVNEKKVLSVKNPEIMYSVRIYVMFMFNQVYKSKFLITIRLCFMLILGISNCNWK